MSGPGPHTTLVAPAFDGPIDVVGDVHGEIDALGSLLRVLGYDDGGEHAQGRRLVFIGDLCDRGPDSPAVIGRVRQLVAAGVAQCLLGNHELSVLRGVRKEANGWFFADDHDRRRGTILDSLPPADDPERDAIREFLSSLPLALEGADLRIVHACWDDERLAELRAADPGTGAAELHRQYSLRAEEHTRALGWLEEAQAQQREYGPLLRDRTAQVPMLDALAQSDVHYQMSNPIRVLTSGTEHRAAAPYFMAGKWRMVERGEWWRDYAGPVPVVFGHYWRWPDPRAGERFGPHARNPFPGRAAHEWLGADDNAFCIDYCVGARFAERAGWPGLPFRSRLGALRWPERELIFEDGSGRETAVAPR
ncbi:MAG: metallophosphoesterase [Steroidobacteraceae bacterium]